MTQVEFSPGCSPSPQFSSLAPTTKVIIQWLAWILNLFLMMVKQRKMVCKISSRTATRGRRWSQRLLDVLSEQALHVAKERERDGTGIHLMKSARVSLALHEDINTSPEWSRHQSTIIGAMQNIQPYSVVHRRPNIGKVQAREVKHRRSIAPNSCPRLLWRRMLKELMRLEYATWSTRVFRARKFLERKLCLTRVWKIQSVRRDCFPWASARGCKKTWSKIGTFDVRIRFAYFSSFFPKLHAYFSDGNWNGNKKIAWLFCIRFCFFLFHLFVASFLFPGGLGWIRELKIYSQILIESRNSPAKFHLNP